ncbi:RDD family protein [Brevibacterium gallinarum]|uniref:RDD family protein n=1 Tax=Brevibacterium gallinarum TaxID=2762220 RepID=A0ABR8WVQ9_9MICO|nr:RDD family protein [Brevibacterium gallinarum]MBD8021164.1 RDD family protein [Brevibacterium gallinarum]
MASQVVPPARRLKELFTDYIVILGYLAVLALISAALYRLVLGWVPEFSRTHTQLIATLTSVVPIVLIFSALDYHRPCGTIGKRRVGLMVAYRTREPWRALVRNAVKFTPWQLAHIGIIDGVYTEFDQPVSHIFLWSGTALLFILLGMGLLRADGRHLGDMLAGTQVVPVGSTITP